MPTLGATEILIILGIVLLLFGGRKLPELARGTGRALRIFKTEVKAIDSDDDDSSDTKGEEGDEQSQESA
ncbi:MAG: twin-arginine translocase TatA/TatE family subunit [Porphyromonadaceae bacterium]|nr:twin-arginine translocase TatA/TatE family subunit [Porphyromonadaceae bacterium]